MYSQNQEEKYILDYFASQSNGAFLEIGAFDPIRFSNTRALFEKGWHGTMVEPSPKCMPRIKDVYANEPKIKFLKEGDSVQWKNASADQWGKPRRIKGFSPDGDYAFFEESTTGIPTNELHIWDQKE